jgi:hypothetical protein
LYLAVGELALRAWDARETDAAQRTHEKPPPPPFISRLRLRKENKARTPDSSNFQLNNIEFELSERMNRLAGNSSFDAGAQVYQSYIDQTDNMLYETGSADVVLVEWEAMDWEYWNQLLESNMAQPETQQLFG